MQKLEGTQILVLNALRKEPHISHFTLGEAVTQAQQLQVKQAWFTHISHQLGMHHEINEELPLGIQLAYDGLQLTIE
jgi:phosphoribosyl 1,2-cyclic phosphate phosphodiesterase